MVSVGWTFFGWLQLLGRAAAWGEQEEGVQVDYSHGMNAYVVKLVDFHEFVNAVKELGIFWAATFDTRSPAP